MRCYVIDSLYTLRSQETHIQLWRMLMMQDSPNLGSKMWDWALEPVLATVTGG